MNIGSGRAGSVFLCSLSSTASRAVSCSLFQGWGLRHTFQVAYVCSFLFQAVFWLISSRDQAVVPAPKLPDLHPGSYPVSTHLRLPKRPVLCHNEESVNLFTYTLCSSVFLWVNKYLNLLKFIIAKVWLWEMRVRLARRLNGGCIWWFSILVSRWAGCLFGDRHLALKLSFLEGRIATLQSPRPSIICRLWPTLGHTLVPQSQWSSRQEAPLNGGRVEAFLAHWADWKISPRFLRKRSLFRKSIEARNISYIWGNQPQGHLF